MPLRRKSKSSSRGRVATASTPRRGTVHGRPSGLVVRLSRIGISQLNALTRDARADLLQEEPIQLREVCRQLAEPEQRLHSPRILARQGLLNAACERIEITEIPMRLLLRAQSKNVLPLLARVERLRHVGLREQALDEGGHVLRHAHITFVYRDPGEAAGLLIAKKLQSAVRRTRAQHKPNIRRNLRTVRQPGEDVLACGVIADLIQRIDQYDDLPRGSRRSSSCAGRSNACSNRSSALRSRSSTMRSSTRRPTTLPRFARTFCRIAKTLR